MRITRRSAILSAGAAVALPYVASAQNFPSRPIRIIVGYGAGNGLDINARLFADFVSPEIKTSVVVENREGANGIIGAVAAAKSAPDGYTLLFVAPPFTYAHLMTPDVSYDPLKDFKAVARLVMSPVAIIAGKNQPFKTFKELIAYAKANPGKVQYATSGKGTTSHLETIAIAQRYGLEMTDIPYKGFSPAITDVISGRVGFYLTALVSILQYVDNNSVNALIVGTPQRAPQLPNTPTYAEEFGDPGMMVGAWTGVVAPAGTPDDVVKYLHDRFKGVLDNPSLRQKIADTGSAPAPLDTAEFGSLLRTDGERWGKIMEELGLRQLKT